MTYHNTTEVVGEPLLDYVRQAHGQSARIMEFFENNPRGYYSASDIWRLVFDSRCPLNSIRGRMSDLTNDGKLSKTDQQKPGIYDRPEYLWRLAKGQLALL